jgi:hypothetical protein
VNKLGATEKVVSSLHNNNAFGLVVALRPHTPKHIRGGWSHYTDTSEPVDGRVGLGTILQTCVALKEVLRDTGV